MERFTAQADMLAAFENAQSTATAFRWDKNARSIISLTFLYAKLSIEFIPTRKTMPDNTSFVKKITKELELMYENAEVELNPEDFLYLAKILEQEAARELAEEEPQFEPRIITHSLARAIYWRTLLISGDSSANQEHWAQAQADFKLAKEVGAAHPTSLNELQFLYTLDLQMMSLKLRLQSENMVTLTGEMRVLLQEILARFKIYGINNLDLVISISEVGLEFLSALPRSMSIDLLIMLSEITLVIYSFCNKRVSFLMPGADILVTKVEEHFDLLIKALQDTHTDQALNYQKHGRPLRNLQPTLVELKSFMRTNIAKGGLGPGKFKSMMERVEELQLAVQLLIESLKART
jgi:hypothetical protein